MPPRPATHFASIPFWLALALSSAITPWGTTHRARAQEQPANPRLYLPLLAPDPMTGRAPVAQTLPSPPELSRFSDLALGPERKLLYAADYENGLRIFDIARPTDPQELSRILPFASLDDGEDHARTSGVEIEWPFAYVALPRNGTAVLDISDPRAPAQVAAPGPPGPWFQAVAVAPWARLLVRGYLGNLSVFDISRRSDPQWLQTLFAWRPGANECPSASALDQLHEHQDAVYYVRSCGITVVTFDADAGAIATRHVDIGLDAWDSAFARDLNRLYVVGAFGGLEVYDVSRPAQPTRVAAISERDFPFWQMDVDGSGTGVAWIGHDRFTPVDLRNASSLGVGETFVIGQGGQSSGDFVLHGDVAYVIVDAALSDQRELHVYDGVADGQARLVRRVR